MGNILMGYSSPTTTLKFDVKNEKRFIKQVIKLIYDADIDNVIFIDGNSRNLSKDNIYISE